MDFSDKTLILMMGLPRSGKSTLARKINKQHGYPIVNPDSFRLAIHGQAYHAPAEPLVWYHVEVAIRSLFLAGHDRVILDATNTSKARRAKWQSLNCTVRVCPIKASQGTCIRRAEEGGREDLIPVIQRMGREMEPLGGEELLYHPDGLIIDWVILKPGETFDDGSDELSEEKEQTTE
jgi:predicted kinase